MPRPLWRPIITGTALVILGACSGDDSSSTPTTIAAVTTIATPATSAPTTAATTSGTSASTAAPTTPGSSTEDHVGPATVESTPLTGGGGKTISLNADQVGSTPTTETVKLNTPVSITMTAATPQEFHLHGYDLEFTYRLDFTADKAGSFELESHTTNKVVMILVVTS
jgi:hypothetical protein